MDSKNRNGMAMETISSTFKNKKNVCITYLFDENNIYKRYDKKQVGKIK